MVHIQQFLHFFSMLSSKTLDTCSGENWMVWILGTSAMMCSCPLFGGIPWSRLWKTHAKSSINCHTFPIVASLCAFTFTCKPFMELHWRMKHSSSLTNYFVILFGEIKERYSTKNWWYEYKYAIIIQYQEMCCCTTKE